MAERRAKSSRYLRDPAYKKECDERNRAKFKAEQAAKPPVPKVRRAGRRARAPRHAAPRRLGPQARANSATSNSQITRTLAPTPSPSPAAQFGIIIPIIPVGIPEYDGGERFDLRLPYVDSGWVDEDDDYDIGQKFLRVLGLGRKKEGGEGEGEGKGGKGGGQKR